MTDAEKEAELASSMAAASLAAGLQKSADYNTGRSRGLLSATGEVTDAQSEILRILGHMSPLGGPACDECGRYYWPRVGMSWVCTFCKRCGLCSFPTGDETCECPECGEDAAGDVDEILAMTPSEVRAELRSGGVDAEGFGRELRVRLEEAVQRRKAARALVDTKTYQVLISVGDFQALPWLVVAETAAKALAHAVAHGAPDEEDWERVVIIPDECVLPPRLPDGFVGVVEARDHPDEYRGRGWSEDEGGRTCEVCELHEWSDLPHSKICDDCYRCRTCCDTGGPDCHCIPKGEEVPCG